MIGRRSSEASLFDVGNVFSYRPDPRSFFGQLAAVSDRLFDDDQFAAFYSRETGRPSVPPSQLALVLLLQNYSQVSDEEAIRRTKCDLDWAAVLRRLAGEPLCAKSTLCLFRAHLVLHEEFRTLLQQSLAVARKAGLLKGQHLKSVADTKPILGRGAVQDTYNLLATGMVQLARAIARSKGEKPDAFLADHGFDRLTGKSVKGCADIDWSDEQQRSRFLTELVGDAHRLMELANGSEPQIKRSAELLEQLLLQDIAEDTVPDDGDGNAGRRLARIKRGVTKGRIPSVTDPEQRHGRKSASKRFTGSKASIAADVHTGLILATEVLAADDPDATGILELIRQAETNSGSAVTETIADCAYGSGPTRQAFEEAGRELIAKVPAAPTGPLFPKSAFRIELPAAAESLEHTTVTCPGGAVANMVAGDGMGGVTFYFDEHCAGCALRALCTNSVHGRSVHIHAQERLIQAARHLQSTQDGRAKLRTRLAAENALARLGHLGIGQARYFGRSMTCYQLTMAATIANLRRTWNWKAEEARRTCRATA
jgi:hypothetical protein